MPDRDPHPKPMPKRFGTPRMFETRSESWQAVGLSRQISRSSVKRARVETLVFVPLYIAIVIVFDHRDGIFGTASPGVDTLVRAGTVAVLLLLGWAIARDLGRLVLPPLFRRMDPATAGSVGFLVRLITVGVTALVGLTVAGINPKTLVVTGAFTAVIVGLAAQQTLGNVIAGTVLISARPFRVGERVRFQGGSIGGRLEGTVSSLGLLYTTLASGDDAIMVPNSVVLSVSVTPIREPDAVDLRARLRPGVTPGDLQALLEESLQTPLRDAPRITLEELDGEEVVVRISATPRHASDGQQLASELLDIVSAETRAAEEAREAEGDQPAALADPGERGPHTS
jgi:small conductance mechanosensitive channel